MAKYTIGTGNAITFTIGDIEIVQPTWPDGTKWKSKTEAEAWAKLYVAHLDDELAPRPGNSPEQKVLEVTDLEMTAEEREADAAAAAESLAAYENALKADESEEEPTPVVPESEPESAE